MYTIFVILRVEIETSKSLPIESYGRRPSDVYSWINSDDPPIHEYIYT